MLPEIEKRMGELAGKIEDWACRHVGSRSFPAYNSRWYNEDTLKSCYCLGADDAFPCPHCMDYNGLEKVFGHPALVAEYASHWRALLFSDTMLNSGTLDLAGEAQHLANRLSSAYHLYAVSHGHLTVTRTSAKEFLVQDKPGTRESRNAILGMRGLPPKTAPVSPVTSPIAYTVGRGPSVMMCGGTGGGGGSPAADAARQGLKATALYDAYKRHLEHLLNIHATSMNKDGDVMLVTGGLLDDLIKVPHEAGYVIYEQALVVKIQAKDLLKAKNRRDEQERMAQEIIEEWMADTPPVNDWLAAALETPRMSMCHDFGHSQEPSYKRSGRRR